MKLLDRQSLNVPLRRVLGVLGLALPWTLVAFNQLEGLVGIQPSWSGIQPSLSAYFFTNSRDLFTGFLYAFGVFLLTYKGYEGDADDKLSTGAGISALLIAFFPSLQHFPPDFQRLVPVLGILPTTVIHYGAAITFFTITFVLATFFFTRSHHPRRNTLYLWCGWTIFASLMALLAFLFLPEDLQRQLDGYSYFFWFETLALSAFGVAWLVKGGVGEGGLGGETVPTQ